MFNKALKFLQAAAASVLASFTGYNKAKSKVDRVRYRPAPAPDKQARGIERRLNMHRLSCLQAYQAKAALVRLGVGNHTMHGIPDLAGVSV